MLVLHQNISVSFAAGAGVDCRLSILLEVALHKGGDESVLQHLKCLLLVRTPCEGFLALCHLGKCSGDLRETEYEVYVPGA